MSSAGYTKKLRDQLRHLEIPWPPQIGFTEQKIGQRRLQPEQLCTGTIESAAGTRDRHGVLFTISHPDWEGKVRPTTTVPDKLPAAEVLAANLLKTAQEFVGKTVEQLGETDVTDLLERC
jgi:hypothetical protein